MSRYIDADALIAECEEELKDESLWHDEDTTKDYAEGHDDGKRIIMNIIDSAPSIDIVRCKECVKRMREDCPMCNGCKLDRVPTEDNDFCSYGEREGE